MRTWVIAILNVLVPGGGLIVLRREWLGLALALLFALLTQLALLGELLLPAVIPPWGVACAAAAAVVVWAWAQWLVSRRLRTETGRDERKELAILLKRADQAVTAGDLDEAEGLLRAALTVNDENVEANRRWAQLLTTLNRPEDAAHAWRRYLQLAPHAKDRDEIETTLSRLSSASTG